MGGGERGYGQRGLRLLIVAPPNATLFNEQSMSHPPGLALAPGEAFPGLPPLCGPSAARRQRLLHEVLGLRPGAPSHRPTLALCPAARRLSVCGYESGVGCVFELDTHGFVTRKSCFGTTWGGPLAQLKVPGAA